MALESISTYSVYQTTINDVGKVMSDLATAQRQISSGQRAADFREMHDQAQQYLSMDAIIRRTDQYLNDNQVIATRVNTTNAVLDQIISVATTLQNLIAQRRTGVTNQAAFAPQLSGIWEQVAGQLNSTVSGQYIFSGTKTDTAPIDVETFPTLLVPETPDDSYYHGSQQDRTARPQDNTEITYNVRADASGLQKIIAGLATAKAGDAVDNDAQLAIAFDLVKEGIQEVINTQATVNATKVQLSTINDNLSRVKLYWKGIQEGIGNTDIISVSTQVAVNQGILQASFQTFAKITALRLSDYLR